MGYGVADGGPMSQGFYGHGVVFATDAGGSFTDLYKFPSSGKDGFLPERQLVVGDHGWLFGVTYVGGENGCGTIFRIKAEGPLHTIYDFLEVDGWPVNSLTAGADGHLYGSATSGGPGGYGTVFRVTPQGKFSTLAAFDGNNGGFPSLLVQGPDGLFYGTAWQLGHGIVFSVGSDSPLQTRYTFTKDDGTPEGPVFVGADGSLYGSTMDGLSGAGIIFRLTSHTDGRVD